MYTKEGFEGMMTLKMGRCTYFFFRFQPISTCKSGVFRGPEK